jgi:two-component system, NarL family, sensor kinase
MYLYTHAKAPDIQFRIAQVYTEKSTLARYAGDYKKASSELLKAIDIFTKLEKYRSLLITYINLASIYKEMNEFEIEAKYAKKAIDIARKTSKPEDFFITYSNVALALNMMNDYKHADLYIDSATKNYSDKYMFDKLVTFHLIAGLIDMNLKKMHSATNHFQNCYKISVENKFVYGMIQSRLQLSRVLTLEKKFGEAEPLLLSVYEDAKKSNETSQMLVILDYLSRFYEESGNYRPALSWYKDYKQLSDSVSSEENKDYLSGLEVKYDLATKENLLMSQKAQLLKRRNFAYLLSGFLITASLTVLFLIINFKHKQKIQQQRINELEREKQLEAAEAVVKGEELERSRLARDLHDGLGGMLSGIKHSFATMKGNLIMTPDNVQAFERSMDMLDSSIKEMRRVAHNMMPEALIRFGLDTAMKDFCNEINQSGALKVNYQSIGIEGVVMDSTIAITLYRIVQELLNNVMKHAGATSAIVQVTKSNELLSLTVEDDGKGFETSILKMNKGIGWVNIQNRVDFLKGKLDIRSKEGEGTSVQIDLNA